MVLFGLDSDVVGVGCVVTEDDWSVASLSRNKDYDKVRSLGHYTACTIQKTVLKFRGKGLVEKLILLFVIYMSSIV